MMNKKSNIEAAVLSLAHRKNTLKELINNHVPKGGHKNPTSDKIHASAIKSAKTALAEAKKALAARRVSDTNHVNVAITGRDSGNLKLSVRNLLAAAQMSKALLVKQSENIKVYMKKYGMKKDAAKAAETLYRDRIQKNSKSLAFEQMRSSTAAVEDLTSSMKVQQESEREAKELLATDQSMEANGKEILASRREVMGIRKGSYDAMKANIGRLKSTAAGIEKFQALAKTATSTTLDISGVVAEMKKVEALTKSLDKVPQVNQNVKGPTSAQLQEFKEDYEEAVENAEKALTKQKADLKTCTAAEKAAAKKLMPDA
jgi:hypothetical protein